jgi:hypothetical protein
MRLLSFVQLTALALWLGGGAMLMMVSAPAAFAGSPDRTTAANVVGIMLSRWHYLSLILPLLLLAVEWRRDFASSVRLIVLVVAIVLAASQITTDLRIRHIRTTSIVPISELPPAHALRRNFGMLHGLSSILMLSQLLAAAGYAATLRVE